MRKMRELARVKTRWGRGPSTPHSRAEARECCAQDDREKSGVENNQSFPRAGADSPSPSARRNDKVERVTMEKAQGWVCWRMSYILSATRRLPWAVTWVSAE